MTNVPVKKYKVQMIEEGLGNTGTCFYYTRDALQYAADNKVFEGKKCYANHPDKIEEQTLPERSVRDIVGYYENTHVEEGPAGQALLIGTLVMPQSPALDWARVMVESALDTAGKFQDDFIGVSINASGNSNKFPVESFLEQFTLPLSAQSKVFKAKAEGMTDVEVCTKLTEAVSCDLVTEAGAGGRILKMLESERKKSMAKKLPGKNGKVREADGDAADGAVDPATDPSHGDVNQDIELIKSLLAEYCGNGEDQLPTEEECQAMSQALEHAKEMGLEGKEMHQAAGYAMKMAKHVASKQAAEADAPPPAAPGKKAPPAASKNPPAPGDAAADDDTDGDTQEAKLESRVVRLEAQNAKLLSDLNVAKLEKHVDKAVRESGLPKHAQKKFRECLAVSKSVKEADDRAKLFKEAFGISAAGEVGFTNPEKIEGASEGGFTFADCVETN